MGETRGSRGRDVARVALGALFHRRTVFTALLVMGPLGLATALLGAPQPATQPILPPPPAARSEPHFEYEFSASVFQRGNLHTHTRLSDGDSTPDQAITWYRTHGYQFLALTDHNVWSSPAQYEALQDPSFVLLSGEEITMTGHQRQVHVNALCTRSRIPGGTFATASAALWHGVRSTLAQRGVAIVNHPNFDWALSPEDVIDARDASLLEIASAHPYVRTHGDATHPSHEQLWDLALTRGARFMGVAVDDVHRIDVSGNPLALPGHAWVQVFSERLTEADLCAALAQGQLYSSTGVELDLVAVSATGYTLQVRDSKAVVAFIGAGGEVLERVPVDENNRTVTYRLRGDEGYVRARVEGAHGKRAFTPAVRVVDRVVP